MDKAGNVHLNLHSGQHEALYSPNRFTFMISGTQGGKTVTGPPWLYNQIVERGPGDYLAATSNYGLFRLKMLPAMIEYFDKILHVGKFWAGIGVMEIAHPKKGFLAKSQNDEMYARIILRSVASPASLESATAKAAWLDECGQAEFKYEGWEAIQRRLSIHQGPVLGTTTPYNLGWLKTHVYDRWVAGDTDYNVIQFASVKNPAFPMEEFERAERTLPGWRFDMFYRALFVKPYGLIYKEYEEPGMLSQMDLGEIPDRWNLLIGIDFGGANMGTLYGFENMDKDPTEVHLCYEFLEGNMSTKEHAQLAHKRMRGRKRYRAVGGAPSETQNRIDWRQEGLRVEQPSVADLEVGISNVIELFKAKRLYVHPSLGGLRHELSTYSRKVTPEGDVLDDIQDKNIYHRLDALRYLCTLIKGGHQLAGTWRK